MLADSRTVELTRQFYAWELRGRGWACYPQRVVLEPPFRPFGGPEPPLARVDDARRHTWLSAAIEQLRGKQEEPAELPSVVEEPAPLGDLELSASSSLEEFVLAIPADAHLRRDALSLWLRSLSTTAHPIALEILGGGKRVEVRLAVAAEDSSQVVGQLRAALPEVIVLRAEETIAERWEMLAGQPLGALEFGLASEFMVPLASSRPGAEPLLPIVAALADVDEGELGVFQVLFEETREPWAPSVVRSVTTVDGKPFFADAPEVTKLAAEKISSPLFAVALRLAAGAADAERAWEIVRSLAGGLAQFGTPRTNELMPLPASDLDDLEGDILDRTTHRSGMLLSCEELVSLIQLPGAGVRVPELWRGGAKSKAAPEEVLGDGCLLGTNEHQGQRAAVRLSAEAKTKHVHVIGASGTGKSSLLIHMILEDIENGHGVGVIDPHGDLIDEVIARIPEDRITDVVLFDPSDEEAALGWNILSAETAAERDLLSSDLVGVFRRLSTSWGDQMTAVLGNAISVFLENERGGTLLDLRQFLLDEKFRREMLHGVGDEHIVSFWEQEFRLLVGRRPQAPILTRLDTFLRSKLIRRIVTAQQPTLDFRSLTDGGRIFLGKLAQGAIGEENAALLGSLLVSKIHQVTLTREAQDAARRRPFFLYIDEFHHVATSSMASLFSGARKYRLGLTVAHQDLYQLHSATPEVERALMGNAYTRVYFRVGEEDARQLARGFSFFTAEDLMDLRLGEAICRVGGRDADFNLRTEEPEPVDPEDASIRRDQIRRLMAERFGAQPKVSHATESPAAVTASEPEAPVERPMPSRDLTAVQAAPSQARREPKLDKAVLDYLALVARSPFLSVRERNRELGLSAWRGERLKRTILKKGFAIEVAVNPGGRGERFKLMELSASGRSLLTGFGVAPPSGHGRGGTAHQWWVHTIAQWLSEQGVNAQIEDASRGARVDLSFTTAGQDIAVEIEMGGGHVLDNVRKDLASGYGRVVCLLDDSSSLDTIKVKLTDTPNVLVGDLRAFGAMLAPLLPTLPPLQRPNQNEERRRPAKRPPLMPSGEVLSVVDPGALSTPAAAEYLGLSPATLETLRTRGGGPPFVKLGRRVVYRREDLDQWLAQGRRSSTSDEPTS